MTKAEKLLWYQIRAGKLGTRFRRQHAVGNYILDFVSLEHSLVIEVDGATHGSDEDVAYDRTRTMALELLGFRVIRFTNDDIYNAISSVIDNIVKVIRTD